MRAFLTARWAHLALLQFPVPREILEPYLPEGLELDMTDLYRGHGMASLVAFDFENVRVLGVPWPLHTRFPEINLRFYVRDRERRGVVFVKELVPRPAVAFLARWLYNEPYATAPMRSSVGYRGNHVIVRHRFRYGGRKHSLEAVGQLPGEIPPEGSEPHLFKEHSWGFGRGPEGETLVYRVDHPVWRTFPVTDFHLDLDWSMVYGPVWGFLQGRPPHSVLLAEGSAISVFPHGRLS